MPGRGVSSVLDGASTGRSCQTQNRFNAGEEEVIQNMLKRSMSNAGRIWSALHFLLLRAANGKRSGVWIKDTFYDRFRRFLSGEKKKQTYLHTPLS